ncbi:hypothetical protein SMICM304S_09524 [Streptomyces microflavus]
MAVLDGDPLRTYSSGWSWTFGKRTKTPPLALPAPGASSRHWSFSEKSPYARVGNQSMPMPSTVVELVIDPSSSFRPNLPPPTWLHLASEAAVPSKSLVYPSDWPGFPMPDC